MSIAYYRGKRYSKRNCMTEGSDEMKNKNPKQQKINESPIHFKGTFIAVMLLGVFLVASWFGIYALFLSR